MLFPVYLADCQLIAAQSEYGILSNMQILTKLKDWECVVREIFQIYGAYISSKVHPVLLPV